MATDEAQPATPLSAKAKGKQRAEPLPSLSEKARGKQRAPPYGKTPYEAPIKGRRPKGSAPFDKLSINQIASSADSDAPDPAASTIALHKYRLNAIQTGNWSTWLSTETEWQRRLRAMDEICDDDKTAKGPGYKPGRLPKHEVTHEQKLRSIHNALSTRDMSPEQRRARLDRTMDIILGRKRAGCEGEQDNPVAMDSSDDLASMAEEMSARSSSPEVLKVVPKRASYKPPRGRKTAAETLLTSSHSPLATTDIRAMLCDPKSWIALSDAEQDEVVSLLPARSVYRCPNTNKGFANIVQLRNDDGFRHACAAYATHLRDGLHDRQWLAQAWAASSLRKKGVFDAYLVQKFEFEWNIKVPENLLPRRMRESLATFQAAERERIQPAVTTDGVASTQPCGPAEAPGPEENVNVETFDQAFVRYLEAGVTQGQQQEQPYAVDPSTGEAMNLMKSTETDPVGKTGVESLFFPAEAGSGHRIAGELLDLINVPYDDSAGSKVASNSESQDLTSRNTTTEGSMSMDIDDFDSPNINAEGSRVEAETPGTSTSPVRQSPFQGIKRKRVRFSDKDDEFSN